jgi:thiamine-phosphate diphosphorylase
MSLVPRLHVVTTREILEREDFPRTAHALLASPDVALHLRARGSSGRLLLERARACGAGAGAGCLVVNDRVDVALLSGAGAHLPEAGLTPAQARTILGPGPLLGRSVHDPPPAPAGSPEPDAELLDYVIYGHVFETPSKAGEPPRGRAGLERAVRRFAARGLPVVAIGGVTPSRVREVLEAGAFGVAAVSGIWQDPDPAGAATRYLAALSSES